MTDEPKKKRGRGRPRLTDAQKAERAAQPKTPKKKVAKPFPYVNEKQAKSKKITQRRINAETRDERAEERMRLAGESSVEIRKAYAKSKKTMKAKLDRNGEAERPITVNDYRETATISQQRRGQLIEERLNKLNEDARGLAFEVHKESSANLLKHMSDREREYCLMISTGISPEDAAVILFPKEIEEIERVVRLKFKANPTVNEYMDRAIGKMCRVIQGRPVVRAYQRVLDRLGATRIGLTLEMADERLIDAITANPASMIEETEICNVDGSFERRLQVKSVNSWGTAEKNSISKFKTGKSGAIELSFVDRLKALDMFYKRHGEYKGYGPDGSGGNTVNVQVNANGEQVHVVAMPGNNGRGDIGLDGSNGSGGGGDDD